ncbi:phosphoglucosamine mutase [Stigmatella aurantiaca]|uniref:Phosphoglucosamine mutase n=1 Tax=Stigmatella aurantiaca (strain DW4/3-1) TaxID=378806 RepID=Q08QH6_STIAD|nr:phosphoglucosamine mutase [Stigmatella aurantiaca]ADO72512.1 Phosphoglucosamine mutase [Stigmatella aurantiaca DW4/3-1]EAU62744.1 phosphoglucosamine mutase [Stigmatella aurantiaca DW4/3-1]
MAYKVNMSPKEERASQRLFGTDGVRGVANVYPMTAEVAMQLGRALAYLIRNGPHRHRVIIGKDTRLSGYMLEQALSAGITSMGVDVWLTGPLPTPGISNLTTSMRADAGAVISASHNPYQDNGIKFFWRDGFKLPDETEAKIEELLSTGAMDTIRPTADNIGRAFRLDDARGRYIVFLKATFPRELTLEGMTIVVDCANGAAYKTAPAVLEELGAKVITLGVSPDGKNINEKCGALHPENLAQAVVAHGARLGLALDGDADRLIVVDEKGKVVDGDAIMAICTSELVARQELKKNTLVATVMSNIGLERAVARFGVKVARTRVGDRYVVEEMRKHGYNLGGEQSGHLLFLDHATTGDGTLAALQLLAVMCRQGKPLSELASIFEPVPQTLVNITVRHKRELGELPEVMKVIQSVEQRLGNEGRVLVRFSGTEPKVRILIEGEDGKRNEELAREIAEALSRALN